MITATYYRKLHKVTIKGHAKTAEKGRDLLCASVSVLAYTLAANAMELRDMGATRHITTRLDEGDTEISVVPKSRHAAVTELVLSSVCVGLELLASQHPNNITYHDVA